MLQYNHAKITWGSMAKPKRRFYNVRCTLYKYRNNIILAVCHGMYTYFRQVLQIYGQRSDEVATRHNSNSVFCDLPCDMENPALLVTGTCNIHDFLFSYLDSSRLFFIFLDDHLAYRFGVRVEGVCSNGRLMCTCVWHQVTTTCTWRVATTATCCTSSCRRAPTSSSWPTCSAPESS